jgi:hypothetical protein
MRKVGFQFIAKDAPEAMDFVLKPPVLPGAAASSP